MPTYEVVISSAEAMLQQEKLSVEEFSNENRRMAHAFGAAFAQGKVAKLVSLEIHKSNWENMFSTDVQLFVEMVRMRSNVEGWQLELLAAVSDCIRYGKRFDVDHLFRFTAKYQKCPVHGTWLKDGYCHECYVEDDKRFLAGDYTKAVIS